MIYKTINNGLQPFTIGLTNNYNSILGTVHNGLSTKAERFLTKVQATTLNGSNFIVFGYNWIGPTSLAILQNTDIVFQFCDSPISCITQ